jgi:hypothetical protein
LPRMRTAKGTPHRLAARNLTALLVASLVLPCISLASVTAWQRLRLRVPGAPLAAAGGAGNMRAAAPVPAAPAAVPAAAAAVPAAAAAVNGSAGGDADAVPRLLVPGAADAAFRRALETRKIILTGKTGGGIGNQMQDVLEQLELVTKFETLYVLPGSTPRSGGSPVPPEDVWNVDNLERQLEAAVFRRLPDVCSESAGGKFDVTFTRVDAVARDDVAGMEIVRSSLHTGKGVRVKFLRKGLEKVDDLRAVLTALLLKTPREVQRRDLRRRALCVYVDNHAAGSFWKFGQYMIPSEKYMRIARQWPLESMAVVHLRYEELDKRGCSAGPPPGKDSRHHVCVKPRSGVVRWVPHKVYAERVAKYLDANDIDTVYFTQVWNGREGARVARCAAARSSAFLAVADLSRPALASAAAQVHGASRLAQLG